MIKLANYKKKELRKSVSFVNNAALQEIRDLPGDIRQAIGYQLHLVQSGEMSEDYKTMSIIGDGTIEIRVKNDDGKNVGRCFYVAKFDDTVYVLHSFIKRARKTPEENIRTGQLRYKIMKQQIAEKEKKNV